MGAYAKITWYKALPGNKNRVISIRVPQSKFPLFMRPKTTDPHAFRQVFVKGDYDFPVPFTPKVIVDAGAHVGYASVYLASRFPEVTIFAIEPELGNLEIYHRNLSKHGAVKLFRGALWGSQTALDIANPDADTWSFRMMESRTGESSVNTITMPEIITKVGDIDLLKLDIEGGEKQLFEKDPAWLARVRMVVLELHERYAPGCTRLIDDVLTSYGFTKTEEKGENVIYQKLQ